jgi:hypothetical protein
VCGVIVKFVVVRNKIWIRRVNLQHAQGSVAFTW